jgi:hypothetical protein
LEERAGCPVEAMYQKLPEGTEENNKNSVEFEVVKLFKNSCIFLDIALCSPLKVNRSFGGMCRLHLQFCFPRAFMLLYFVACPSTLKLEVTCSSETSVDFQRTTRCHNTELFKTF